MSPTLKNTSADICPFVWGGRGDVSYPQKHICRHMPICLGWPRRCLLPSKTHLQTYAHLFGVAEEMPPTLKNTSADICPFAWGGRGDVSYPQKHICRHMPICLGWPRRCLLPSKTHLQTYAHLLGVAEEMSPTLKNTSADICP